MRAISARFDPALATLLRARYACELLLEERLWLFLLADAVIVLQAVIGSLSSGGELEVMYRSVVVVPQLLLGLPGMSAVVALERRAGSLDLALAVPSTERYFVRRVAPVCGALIVQGWVLLILLADPGWDRVRGLIQSAEIGLLLAALTLFWAVRLTTSGAVLVGSLLSVGVLSRWIFYSPVIDSYGPDVARLAGVPVPILAWVWNAAVLAAATVILLQYARRRLRRPEVMLG